MFKGMGQLGDMAKLVTQAKEMQSKMTDAQAALDQIEVVGEAGAGMVTATVTAKGRVKALNVDATLFNPDDKEVVEDLIIAALNDAQEKAAARSKEEMQKVTAGLNLPAGMELPF